MKATFERAWGVTLEAEAWAQPDARCSGRWMQACCRGLFVIGENPAQSEADQNHSIALLEGLDISSCRRSS